MCCVGLWVRGDGSVSEWCLQLNGAAGVWVKQEDHGCLVMGFSFMLDKHINIL